jgi:hypothetical protein
MRKIFTKAALAAAVLAGASTSSHAYLIMEIAQIGGGSLICNTQTLVGCAGFGFTVINPELLSFTATVGDFQVSGTFGESNSPGTSVVARLDASSLRVERVGSAGSGQLFIGLKAFDFADPNGIVKTLSGSAGSSTQQIGTGAGNGANTVSTNFWADPTNAALPTNLISCSYAITTNGSCATPSTLWNDPLGSGGGLFSLRMEQLFDMKVGTSLNSTAALAARNLPEPMSATLVGVALVGLALASRRSKKA